MTQTIFSTMDGAEDRQICERMASKNLDLAQRESILFLTGISQDSPYYSPPALKKRSIFQLFLHHALRFASRVENPPLFPSITGSASQNSSLSERVVVPSGLDPLSISIPVVDEQPSVPTVSPISVTGDIPSVAKAFTPYQLILTLQAARLLSWRRTVPNTSVAEEVAQPAKSQNVAGPQTSDARPFLPRCFDSPTGFVTSTLRASLFDSEMDDCTGQEDMIPLLTPLQRAIAQAREHGYHLHPRQSLSSLSPTSPTSPSLSSPPGLAHLRNRYTLRSHQVAAGDYFRKEATHRAAVAARNLNRQLLIKKVDRSLYEPSGIIMPEFELTRLRVVQAPKRFPVRLWKREYRGPADWIEVDERTPMGGPVIFKRDSHLRKELILRVRRTPVPKFSALIRSSVDKKVPVAIAEDVKNTRVTLQVPSQIAIQSTERDQEEPSRLTPAQMANLLQIIKRRTKAAEQLSCEVATVVEDHVSNVDTKEEISPGDVSSPAAAMKPLGLRVDTQVDRPATPGCLDPVMAEMHRKSLLKKYYNAAPKPSLTPTHIRDAEAAVMPKVVDPSSSEETLCEIAQESAEKIKPSSVEPQKQAPTSVSISNMVKIQNASALPVERPSRMSLSPRKALRAVKHQARNLGF